MTYFCGKSVVSVSSVCDSPMREELDFSSNVRNETLNRLTSLPSYPYKSLKWKNRYYEYFKKKVLEEMGR